MCLEQLKFAVMMKVWICKFSCFQILLQVSYIISQTCRSTTDEEFDNETDRELVKLTPFICEESFLPESQVAELQIVEKEAEK